MGSILWEVDKYYEKDFERAKTSRDKIIAILARSNSLWEKSMKFEQAKDEKMFHRMLKDASELSQHGLYLQKKLVGQFCYDRSEFQPNLALNEGITVLLNLLIGGGGTVFSNANAYTGVGDSSTAAAASQTGLQAATNKLYKAMDTSYPSIANQTITFQSTFQSADANFAWNEFTIANGSSDASTNLNRKVSAQGTKASGQVWTCQVAITQG